MSLGRFQEALLFDEKAVAEIHRCADEGDGISLEETFLALEPKTTESTKRGALCVCAIIAAATQHSNAGKSCYAHIAAFCCSIDAKVLSAKCFHSVFTRPCYTKQVKGFMSPTNESSAIQFFGSRDTLGEELDTKAHITRLIVTA